MYNKRIHLCFLWKHPCVVHCVFKSFMSWYPGVSLASDRVDCVFVTWPSSTWPGADLLVTDPAGPWGKVSATVYINVNPSSRVETSLPRSVSLITVYQSSISLGCTGGSSSVSANLCQNQLLWVGCPVTSLILVLQAAMFKWWLLRKQREHFIIISTGNFNGIMRQKLTWIICSWFCMSWQTMCKSEQ